jgi:hypothetical protein
LGIWWGMYARTLRGSFHFDSSPKSVSRRARFWSFLLSRVRGVFSRISSIPLDLASFGAPNLGYGVPMRCSSQSLVRIRGTNRQIEIWIWELTRGLLFIPRDQVPRAQVLTGLTNASHRSDRCRPFIGFCSGELFGQFPGVLCCCCFEFGQFWSSEGLFGEFRVSWLRPV